MAVHSAYLALMTYKIYNNIYGEKPCFSCPSNTDSRRPSIGFRYARTTGSDAQNNKVFVSETGSFNVFSLGSSNMLYVTVAYELCHGHMGENGDPKCQDVSIKGNHDLRKYMYSFNSVYKLYETVICDGKGATTQMSM